MWFPSYLSLRVEGGHQCLQSGWDGKIIVKHFGLRVHKPLCALQWLSELRHEPKLLDSPPCFTFRKFPTSWEIYLAEPQPKIKQDYYPSDLEKISIWCCYPKANRPTWKSHLWATQSSNWGNWEPGCCLSSFGSPCAADQCYSTGSSSPLVNTLYWVTQHICFQFVYSCNLAYNFSSTASAEIFIRRGKAVKKIHQSWIWFLAWPLTQAIIMQIATGLPDFMHKDLLSWGAGAKYWTLGEHLPVSPSLCI